MREVFFEPLSNKQFLEWRRTDKKIFQKIDDLLDDACQNPFSGTGKPEPLKHELKGCWSRRITKEHRLVYTVTDDAIIVISCKYHY
ncbi:MAG: Txe/YoeB family addiction module toxin [Cytophagales bacterium]|nr:Txe/YoeB family addiction module toxin [Cytophagales bacterium]